MQWCAHALVCRVNTKPSLLEICNTDRLITLRCNMNHVDSLSVDCKYVCAVLYQEPNQFDISMERRKMQRCKPIVPLTIQIYVVSH